VTFAAPLFVWVAAAAAVAAVGLHLLAWRRPPESFLPTARFAPDAPIRTVSRAVRPADLALLALRVMLLLLVGAALAGPTLMTRARGLGRVLVVDRSRSATGQAVTDAARRELRSGDALVLFDSAAREIAGPTADSLSTSAPSARRGSVSAALVAAVRAADRLARAHDSVEIVVVSPFTADELDAATAGIRGTWRGAIRTVRAGVPPNDTLSSGRPEVRAAPGDGVAAALALAPNVRGGAGVRLVRTGAVAADSSWAREGRALVVWPSDGVGALPRRESRDSAFAVTALPEFADIAPEVRSATVVGRFARIATPPPGRVVARWQDGEPAVTEMALGTGCVRTAAVAVPEAGDLAVTPAFRRFVQRMASPCGAQPRWVAASDSALNAALPASVPRSATPEPSAVRAEFPSSRLGAWLLAAALLAAIAELIVRRGADATA